MPTYGYECKSCRHTFDAFQNMADEPLKTCPECGKAIRRLINGGMGIIFKGGGFYVTDKGGAKAGAKAANASNATENKTSESSTTESTTPETKTTKTDSPSSSELAKSQPAAKMADSA